MTVYLDNNVVGYIEDGVYSLNHIKSLLPQGQLSFYYSPTHLFEADAFQGNNKTSKEDFLKKRFGTLQNNFSHCLYLNYQQKKVIRYITTPKDVYENITSYPDTSVVIRGFTNMIPNSYKQHLREQLGIDTKKLNNYDPLEVVEHLGRKLGEVDDSPTFMDFVEKAINFHPDAKEMGLHNRFAAIFEMLDMLGYWKDVQTVNSNYARMWDAFHVYYGSYCDYFISDDQRTRNKAKVLYNIYGIETTVLSSKG